MENEKKNKRKALILTIIAVLTLLALVGGATYAYFQAQAGEGGQADVNVTTGTTDSLTFSVLDKVVTSEGNEDTKENIIDDNNANEIVINAKESNFGKTGTSLGDGVTGSAILIAGSDDYIAEDSYNVYLNITKNELQYSSYKKDTPDEPDTGKNVLTYTTTEEKSKAITEEALTGYSPIPELYLTVKKNGTEIKTGVTINGVALNYTAGLFGDPDSENKTEKTLGGFDITEAKGLITIVKEETIEVKEGSKENHTTTDEWEIMITFKNLENDQNLNTGKEVTGEVIIQQEEYASDSQDNETLNKLLAEANKDGKYTLYHHNAEDLTDPNMQNSEKIASDDSYRYSGPSKDVHNYVCFGSSCSNEGTNSNYKNLYRIIGLFKNADTQQYEMKIIKADYATKEDLGEGTFPESAYYGNYSSSKTNYKGKLTTFASYYWNSTSGTDSSAKNVNMWVASNLNTKNLNEKYYNAIEESYKEMVVEHEWQVGGTYDTGDAKSVYDYELGSNKLTNSSQNCYNQGKSDYSDRRECNQPNDLTYKDEVGLMYVSDYMYATLPQYWTTETGEYSGDDVKTNNWMYLGINEWTISRTSTIGGSAWSVYYTGSASNYYSVYSFGGVRPVLYLSSDVKITGGSGTDDAPFTLGV